MPNKQTEPRDNWLVAVMKFIFSLLSTGNDKVDKGLAMFAKVCILVIIALILISQLIAHIQWHLPEILEPLQGLIASPAPEPVSGMHHPVDQLPALEPVLQ